MIIPELLVPSCLAIITAFSAWDIFRALASKE